nr:MAG TPA: hypothetical protein [Caudoviricetes sp.]
MLGVRSIVARSHVPHLVKFIKPFTTMQSYNNSFK